MTKIYGTLHGVSEDMFVCKWKYGMFMLVLLVIYGKIICLQKRSIFCFLFITLNSVSESVVCTVCSVSLENSTGSGSYSLSKTKR